MEVLTLPADYENVTMPQLGYIQLNITVGGAFCIISNTATFNPPLPTGLLAAGKYPNPVNYPNGSQATGMGSCNYSFSTAKTGCDPQPTGVIGKVITVGQNLPAEHPHSTINRGDNSSVLNGF